MGLFGINTVSDISKFTKISRVTAAASDIWRVLKYYNIYLKYPEETVLFFVYTTRQRNFVLYVTGVIFTCMYFTFGLRLLLTFSVSNFAKF